MSRRLKLFLLVAAGLVAILGVPALAEARVGAAVTKPMFSAPPVVDVPFTVSGVVRPRATVWSRTVVTVKVFTFSDRRWRVAGSYRAKLRATASGTRYSRRLVLPEAGDYAVQAFRYRAGRLVRKSVRTSFEVARRITIDSNVNGWMAPDLGDATAPADTPLDVVFTTPSDWSSGASERLNGAAHFIWGEFEKVDADGLIWHTDGLRPGRYDWMRDAMPKWGTGCLVVTQHVAIDKTSHSDAHALPYLPADISFGDVSSEGMGCDRSIAFLTRVFTQTSADPLEWYTDGLAPARYDWKCWMDGCHYGTLVADGATEVPIDSDPMDSVTIVPAGTPVDVVFSGARMLCWRTIHFTTASDLTKTRSYPDPVTWRTGGLAPGTYEWECWMGPQCHHGTVVAQ